MSFRLLKLAAPVVAGLGVMAATAPASAYCYVDGWGRQVCTRPPVAYVPPPPVYYAPPPVYVAPAPRVVVAPRPYYRHYGRYHGYYGRPSVSFGFAF